MSTLKIDPTVQSHLESADSIKPRSMVWFVGLLTGLAFAWPLLYAAAAHGPEIIIRSIGGDTYHYLAIARKALVSHIYTYDGVHVTNGFHPLWEYAIRGVFSVLHLQTHESQAITLMLMSLTASTVGVILAAVAVIRFTNRYFLALLLVPGLFYLTVGIHVGGNWIWWVLDGMESSFSLLFGSIFFFVLSFYMGAAAGKQMELLPASRALGLVLPFIILSRLDDVFIIPAFLIAILMTEKPVREKVATGAWIAVPSACCILCYLIYNKVTVGAAMPLSGGTKAGFVGLVSAYLTAAIHLPPIFDLKNFITKTPADGQMFFSNSFRQVEVFYPTVIALFGALAVWKYKRNRPEFPILFALCIFIPFKMGYNFLEVAFWNQDVWYFQFPMLILTVLGALSLQSAWARLDRFPIAKYGVVTIYSLLMMLSASQYYASIVYRPSDNLTIQFWNRKDEVRRQLVSHGVSGIMNFDDGVTAFLLDLPNLHGFAFATDVAAQRAFRDGHMLSLATSRGINTLAGIGYLGTDTAPETQADIQRFISQPLIAKVIRSDVNDFDFSLAYYEPALKMAFISFKPKVDRVPVKPLP